MPYSHRDLWIRAYFDDANLGRASIDEALAAPGLSIRRLSEYTRAGDAVVYDYRTMHRGKAQQLRDTTRPVLKLDFFRQGYADADNDDFCALRGPVLYDGACSELLDTGIAHAGGAIYQGTAMKCPEWAREPGRCRSAETARQCPRSCCLARKRLL